MDWQTSSSDIRWWFWASTLAFIVAALAGWTPGYYVVMAISALQVLFFLAQERSLAAFPTQIRLMDGYNDYRSLTRWSAGEHWPTATAAADSMDSVLDTMNVIAGRTNDAAFVKRLRTERKIFAVHCTDYFPGRKITKDQEDPILAQAYDALNPNPEHVTYRPRKAGEK